MHGIFTQLLSPLPREKKKDVQQDTLFHSYLKTDPCLPKVHLLSVLRFVKLRRRILLYPFPQWAITSIRGDMDRGYRLRLKQYLPSLFPSGRSFEPTTRIAAHGAFPRPPRHTLHP